MVQTVMDFSHNGLSWCRQLLLYSFIYSGISATDPPHLCERCHVSPLLIPSLPCPPLSSSDLSSNHFECDCKLFRLVSWLQEKGVRVRRPDAMLCNHPPELRHQPLLNVSVLTCGTKQMHANVDACACCMSQKWQISKNLFKYHESIFPVYSEMDPPCLFRFTCTMLEVVEGLPWPKLSLSGKLNSGKENTSSKCTWWSVNRHIYQKSKYMKMRNKGELPFKLKSMDK